MNQETIKNLSILVVLLLFCSYSIYNMVFMKGVYDSIERKLGDDKVIFEMSDIDECFNPLGTGSMRPLIYNDSIVCYKNVENKEELSIGDVIIFNVKEIEFKVVHRITNITNNGFYRTRGDYNSKDDEFNTTFKDIKGKVRFVILR